MLPLAGSLAELAPHFGGTFVQPADAQYDEVRRVHNGLIDKRPALIARCGGIADVADAVKLARQLDLEIAVRGGGHNVAGRATCDAGIMIDLSPMKGVIVDAAARTVHAQGGVLWKELYRHTQAYALATPGGVVGTTGVAGLTLGGGLGWLMPKYGLALDNLQSVELVLADGTVCRTSEKEQPDLFWAVRGGGGNFGVAASFEYRLHPVGPIVTGGLVAHPQVRAREVLTLFRETCATASDDVMLVCGLLTAPDGTTKIAGIVGGHFGPAAQAEKDFKPLKEFGPPVMDALGPIPFTMLNSLLDDSFPKGALNYWKSSFVKELDEAVGDVLIEAAASAPTPMCSIVIEHFHGAVTRIPVSATACTLRTEGFNVIIIGEWLEPADTERCKAWVRKTYSSLQPYLGTTRYVNYLEDDVEEGAAAVYGSNYSRLREIKTKYDPGNVFHVNVNIKPA